MDPDEVAALIEDELPETEATVTRPRGVEDDDHLAAEVVSPAFEGESVLNRHELVYDALGDHMTTDIHAVELTTRTPEEAEE